MPLLTLLLLCILKELKVKVAQSCPTLCYLMDCSLPGFSIHGIFQARVLRELPFPSPEDLPDPEIEAIALVSPALAGRFFTTSVAQKRLMRGKET